MTAVTVARRKTNVAGSRKHRTFTISGDNGYTLNTRLRKIESVSFSDTTITSVAISGGTATFSASGAFSNVLVIVTGN